MRRRETPEHSTWRGMIERCERPSHVGFKYYGARGIHVCPRWRQSFADFLADMGRKPTPRHTIERLDTGGNYEPNNCRWATPREQRANQRPYDEAARVQASWDGGNRSRISKGRINMVARQYGRLLVIEAADTQAKRARWLCRCTCGAEKIVSGKDLRQGNVKSCGCWNRESASNRAFGRNREHAAEYAARRWHP